MAQQNGCSMDLAVDEEDGLEGAVDGVVVDGSSAINGHPSAAVTSVDGAAAAGPPPSSSSASPAISRVDRDVIRLIAQHLQNLGLKYVDWRWVKRGCADVWMWHTTCNTKLTATVQSTSALDLLTVEPEFTLPTCHMQPPIGVILQNYQHKIS